MVDGDRGGARTPGNKGQKLHGTGLALTNPRRSLDLPFLSFRTGLGVMSPQIDGIVHNVTVSKPYGGGFVLGQVMPP